MRTLVVVLLLAVSGSALAASTAAADFTWSGAAPGSPSWSDATNWGGTSPSGAVGTLTFPVLRSSACAGMLQAATCYQSKNDVSGLSVNAISIDDDASYDITGDAITLGAGGLTASTTATAFSSTPRLNLPVTLGASQTWSIDGNRGFGGLQLSGNVTGPSTGTLAIDLSNQASLSLAGGDVEVGPVTVNGLDDDNWLPGDVSLGYPGTPGSLNATDGQPIDVESGADFVGFSGTVGPLTVGGQLQVGEPGSPPVGGLSVNGALVLGSGLMEMFITHSGTTARTDYSQLSATGAVDLGGAQLSLSGDVSSCSPLHAGDVDTLITTTGALTGTFSGVPDGASTAVYCAGTPQSMVQINYTAHSVTATVEGTVSTATTLSALPAEPVTNQAATLTATVSATSGTPSGTVSFNNGGMPIAGCESEPLALSGASYTATCDAPFGAASSPQALTATFTPAGGSGLEGSVSPVDDLAVAPDSTTTALGVSNAAPAPGASVTYTAIVTPADAGAIEPSGSVEFLDGGNAIGSCASQPLTPGAGSSSAACTLSYPGPGSHGITATYLADANFTASSSSPAQAVTVPTPSTSTTTTATASAGASAPAGSVGSSQQATSSTSRNASTTSAKSGVAAVHLTVPAKPLTQAHKRAKAIGACGKLKKSKRAKCIAAAKERYPLPKPKHKKK